MYLYLWICEISIYAEKLQEQFCPTMLPSVPEQDAQADIRVQPRFDDVIITDSGRENNSLVSEEARWAPDSDRHSAGVRSVSHWHR